MTRNLFAETIHHSPEITTTDVPVDEIIPKVQKLARFLTVITPNAPTAELVMLPGQKTHDIEGLLELRELVESAFQVSSEEIGMRLLVTTNEVARHAYRADSPGHPINTWHTDFRMRKTTRGGELYVPQKSRQVLIVDGEGTDVLSGEVRTRGAKEFIAPYAATDFEYRMESSKSALLGADGQIIRGPMSRSMLSPHRLAGDFERNVMPIEVWCELPPLTLHQSPAEQTKGRAVLNIDFVD
jgi:hypothetical protein